MGHDPGDPARRHDRALTCPDTVDAMSPERAGPQAAHLGTRPAAPRAGRSAGSAAGSGLLHGLQLGRDLDAARRRDRPRRAPGGLVATRGPRGDRTHHRGPPHPRCRVAALHRAFAARRDRGLPRVHLVYDAEVELAGGRATGRRGRRDHRRRRLAPGRLGRPRSPPPPSFARHWAGGFRDALKCPRSACNLNYMITEAQDTSAIAAWFVGRLPDAWKHHAAVGHGRPRGDHRPGHHRPGPARRGRVRGGRGRSAPRAGCPAGASRPASSGSGSPGEAEARFERKVSWGVDVGGDPDASALFTHLAVPVMTRLRQPQRLVLDTLVEAGVARSRADALAWCVRLVGQHSEEWLTELRGAIEGSRRSATAARPDGRSTVELHAQEGVTRSGTARAAAGQVSRNVVAVLVNPQVSAAISGSALGRFDPARRSPVVLRTVPGPSRPSRVPAARGTTDDVTVRAPTTPATNL